MSLVVFGARIDKGEERPLNEFDLLLIDHASRARTDSTVCTFEQILFLLWC